MPWRLILTPPMAGADNMALDEALMVAARERGLGSVRVYSWSQPTISFGRNQQVEGAFDVAAADRAGVAFVRRITGGRALVHEREITYAVAAPATGRRGLRADYERINRALLEALQALGVAAGLAESRGRPVHPGDSPCFASPALGEVVVGEAKLAGSAQVREAGALLQHGSILIDDDQWRLGALARQSVPILPAAATLRSTLGRPVAPAEFAEAFFRVIRQSWDGPATVAEPDGDDWRAAERLAPRYRREVWTWRGEA